MSIKVSRPLLRDPSFTDSQPVYEAAEVISGQQSGQEPSEVPLIQDDHPSQALATDAYDQAFGDWILP